MQPEQFQFPVSSGGGVPPPSSHPDSGMEEEEKRPSFTIGASIVGQAQHESSALMNYDDLMVAHRGLGSEVHIQHQGDMVAVLCKNKTNSLQCEPWYDHENGFLCFNGNERWRYIQRGKPVLCYYNVEPETFVFDQLGLQFSVKTGACTDWEKPKKTATNKKKSPAVGNKKQWTGRGGSKSRSSFNKKDDDDTDVKELELKIAMLQLELAKKKKK